MNSRPPFRLKAPNRYWLYLMINHFNDTDALAELAWQASIGLGGINCGDTQ